MDVSAIIIQLRNFCPILKSVAGAAEAAVAEELGNLPLPSAYVVPLSQDAEDNTSRNGLMQHVTESFQVLVCFDNRTDNGRGQATATFSYDQMVRQIHRALLNWQMNPESSTRGLSYHGSQMIKQDRARAWYSFVYINEYTLTEDDGFNPFSETLVSIDADDNYTPFSVDLP